MKHHPLYEMLSELAKSPRVWFGAGSMLLVTFCALFASWLAPFSPEDGNIMLRLAPPSSEHWLGCDLTGRDVLTSMLYSARISLYIAVMTVFLNFVIGLLVGLVSGYFGGWLDLILMRIVDVFLAIPQILVAMVLAGLLGGSIHNVIFAIAITGWAASARIVRGQVLTLKERDYVIAAQTLGARLPRTLFVHIFPGTLTPLIVHTTFSLAGVIIVESGLSFLGLGAPASSPTWGALLGQGRQVILEAPHLSIAPGAAIMLVVLSFNFIGDALRDVVDPRKA